MRHKIICFSLVVYAYTVAAYYVIYNTPLREIVESLPYPIADYSNFPGQTAYFLLPICALTVGMAFLCNRLCTPTPATNGGTAVARLFGIELRAPRRMLYPWLVLLLVLDIGFLFLPVDFIALLISRIINNILIFIAEAASIDIFGNLIIWLFYDQGTIHQLFLFLTVFSFLRTRTILRSETETQAK